MLALPSCTKDAKVRISVLIGIDPGGGWKAIAEEFEKVNPGIDVEIIEGPPATDTREDMYSSSLIAQDDTYDLVFMDIIWTSKFAKAGWIIPLDDKFPKAEQDGFLPGDIGGSRWEGKVYRVPMQSDAGVLYYRKDILEEAGLQPPETWEELVQVARRLQDPPGLWGFTFQGDQYEGLVCNFLELVWGAGGCVLDSDGNPRLDSEECLSALKWMVSLVGDVAPPGVTTYQEEESRHVFQEGACIFHRNWPYVWTLAQKEGSPVRGKIGILPMVHKGGHESAATQGGWGFGISRFSRDRDEAWEFVKFATSAQGQKILHLKNGSTPSRHALFKDGEILKESPHYRELHEIQLKARPRPMHPRYSEISDVLQVEVHSALTDLKSPEQALKEAQVKIERILSPE